MKALEFIAQLTKQTSDNKSGIYAIFCAPSSKIYIGQSKNIPKRWYRHKFLLRTRKHTNPYLQNSYNKYGESLFCWHIVEITDLLDEREQFYISQIDKSDIINLIGVSSPFKFSEEVRKRMSQAHKGRKYRLGCKLSDETKRLQSIAKKGQIPWNKGIKMTKEQLEKRQRSKR